MNDDEFTSDNEMGLIDNVDTNRSETIVLKVLIVLLVLALICSIAAYFMLPFELPMIMPI